LPVDFLLYFLTDSRAWRAASEIEERDGTAIVVTCKRTDDNEWLLHIRKRCDTLDEVKAYDDTLSLMAARHGGYHDGHHLTIMSS